MLKIFCSRVIVGLQQAVVSGLSHVRYKQQLLSTYTWQSYGTLDVRCLSAMHSVFANSGLASLQSSARFLQPSQQIVQPCRTRIIYRLRDGEPESDQVAVDRFYRLENGLWIRTRAGRHKKLWKKTARRINRLRQHVFCNATQCRMLDKMVNIEYKTPKHYVDDPYTPYHRKSNLPDYRYRPPKFLP